jgi:hypothetical protein
MIPSPPGTHPDDADLVAWLYADAAPPAPEFPAHLRACAECRTRAARLRGARQLVRDLFDAGPLPQLPPLVARASPPAARRRGPHAATWVTRFGLAAAAAAVVAVAGSLVGSPELQAAVAGWSARLRAALPWAAPRGGARDALRPPPARREPAWQDTSGVGSTLTFAAAADSLVVEFAQRPRPGALVVRRTDARASTFSVSAAAPPASPLLMLPQGVRVRNAAAAAERYGLEVPHATRLLIVRLGPGVRLRLGADRLDAATPLVLP